MEREEIVTNGCSGACCERFTLPVTLNDLKGMKDWYSKYDTTKFEGVKYICEGGFERWPPEESEIDKLLAMLIPLGTTEICPQNLVPLNDLYGKFLDEESKLTGGSKQLEGHFNVVDRVITANVFTCKHFDTENRICTNYDNRPYICSQFGNSCGYKGCGYVGKLIQSMKRAGGEREELNNEKYRVR